MDMKNTRRTQLLRGYPAIVLTAAFFPAGASFAANLGDVSDFRPVQETRTFDGGANNLTDPSIGKAHTAFVRRFDAAYANGRSALAGPNRPSPRAISNVVHTQAGNHPNTRRASSFLWQWGQFLDHDIVLTGESGEPEPAPIHVPRGDRFFDPRATGERTIGFDRSGALPGSGTSADNPREQFNEATAWIDASNVYGSSAARAEALRTHDGTGRLLMSEGSLLPYNIAGLPNAGGDGPLLFVAGDVRANEQLGLLALHTLFVREHNRLVTLLADEFPRWSGEALYQKARQMVGAEMQVITFDEFLPALLGKRGVDRYRGYDDSLNAGIGNAFATAAFRFGHSALTSQLLRLTSTGRTIPEGNLALRDAFFRPDRLVSEGGIEPILRGLEAQRSQKIDHRLIDEIRNFLFGPPGAGGFDLASLNIQRGRDHGLPSYNETRRALGLPPASGFDEVNPDPEVHERLASVYEDVEAIDLYTGGLAEAPKGRSQLGETFSEIVSEQFEALRDGDRFWYRRVLSEDEIEWVEDVRLSDIIRANTPIRSREIRNDIFRYKKRN